VIKKKGEREETTHRKKENGGEKTRDEKIFSRHQRGTCLFDYSTFRFICLSFSSFLLV